jgi:hypothetical protein
MQKLVAQPLTSEYALGKKVGCRSLDQVVDGPV